MCLPKHPTHEGFQQGLDGAKITKVLVSANFLTIFCAFPTKKFIFALIIHKTRHNYEADGAII